MDAVFGKRYYITVERWDFEQSIYTRSPKKVRENYGKVPKTEEKEREKIWEIVEKCE